MKLLVTGFEPFGGEARNPSAEVVEALPGAVAGAEIIKLILPTTRFEAPERVERAVEAHRPDVVLSIGQAGGRAAVSVERFAVNLDDYRIPDNAGNQPADEAVVPGGPDGYLTNLPVNAMVGPRTSRVFSRSVLPSESKMHVPLGKHVNRSRTFVQFESMWNRTFAPRPRRKFVCRSMSGQPNSSNWARLRRSQFACTHGATT